MTTKTAASSAEIRAAPPWKAKKSAEPQTSPPAARSSDTSKAPSLCMPRIITDVLPQQRHRHVITLIKIPYSIKTTGPAVKFAQAPKRGRYII